MVHPDDVLMGQQRYSQSCVRVQGADGEVFAVPGCGGLQGDPYVVRKWVHTYAPMVTRWQIGYLGKHEDFGALFANIPDVNEVIDLSYGVYADDVQKTVVVNHEDRVRDVIKKQSSSNGSMDDAMGKHNLKQNKSKQVVQPNFVGKGSQAQLRRLYGNKHMVEGQVSRVTKYLGSMISSTGSNAAEIESRLKATKGAFHEFYKFWYKQGVAFSFKKLVMQAKVQSTLVSGLEAFIVSDKEAEQLDRLLMQLCRRALAGKATQKLEGGRISKWTNVQVRQKFGLLPTSLELKIRRLRMWLNMLRHPRDALMPLTAIYGAFQFDLTQGIAEKTNPWAEQIWRDFGLLASLYEDEMSEVREYLNAATMHRLFFDENWEDVKERIVELDLRQLRARARGVTIAPPPGLTSNTVETAGQDPPEGAAARDGDSRDEGGVEMSQQYMCNLITGDVACTSCFPSSHALLIHQVMHHGLRKPLNMFVLTNQCPYCASTFLTREIAMDHVARALAKGECRVDQSAYFTPVHELERNRCLYCSAEFNALEALQSHLAQEHSLGPPPTSFFHSKHGRAALFEAPQPTLDLPTFGEAFSAAPLEPVLALGERQRVPTRRSRRAASAPRATATTWTSTAARRALSLLRDGQGSGGRTQLDLQARQGQGFGTARRGRGGERRNREQSFWRSSSAQRRRGRGRGRSKGGGQEAQAGGPGHSPRSTRDLTRRVAQRTRGLASHGAASERREPPGDVAQDDRRTVSPDGEVHRAEPHLGASHGLLVHGDLADDGAPGGGHRGRSGNRGGPHEEADRGVPEQARAGPLHGLHSRRRRGGGMRGGAHPQVRAHLPQPQRQGRGAPPVLQAPEHGGHAPLRQDRGAPGRRDDQVGESPEGRSREDDPAARDGDGSEVVRRAALAAELQRCGTQGLRRTLPQELPSNSSRLFPHLIHPMQTITSPPDKQRKTEEGSGMAGGGRAEGNQQESEPPGKRRKEEEGEGVQVGSGMAWAGRNVGNQQDKEPQSKRRKEEEGVAGMAWDGRSEGNQHESET